MVTERIEDTIGPREDKDGFSEFEMTVIKVWFLTVLVEGMELVIDVFLFVFIVKGEETKAIRQ